MVGKLAVATVCSPAAVPAAQKPRGGVVADHHHIAAQQLAGVALQAGLQAVGKKPTELSAATASSTATMIRRSSPARRSRQRLRSPRIQTDDACMVCTIAQRPAAMPELHGNALLERDDNRCLQTETRTWK
jgi:hypothetical protein